jgi:hypothetical protein
MSAYDFPDLPKRHGMPVRRTQVLAVVPVAFVLVIGLATWLPAPAVNRRLVLVAQIAAEYDEPLGSLARQAAGAGDTAGSVLSSAEHELRASKRRMLSIQLQAAKARQQEIQRAVSKRTARVRRWRQEEQAVRRREQSRAALKDQRKEGIAAIRSNGQLGSWLSSSDRSVSVRDAQSDNAVLNVWRDVSAVPRGRVRSQGGHRGQVVGVADLPGGWFMGGVVLTGAEWRRRLGDAVVDSNLRTDEKVRKLQSLVGFRLLLTRRAIIVTVGATSATFYQLVKKLSPLILMYRSYLVNSSIGNPRSLKET